MVEAEPPVQRVVLRALDGDLELGAARRRGGVEQLVRGDLERVGQGPDERQRGLALAVLEPRQVRRLPSDARTEVRQGEVACLPQVAQPLPEHERVERRIFYVLRSNRKISHSCSVTG